MFTSKHDIMGMAKIPTRFIWCILWWKCDMIWKLKVLCQLQKTRYC